MRAPITISFVAAVAAVTLASGCGSTSGEVTSIAQAGPPAQIDSGSVVESTSTPSTVPATAPSTTVAATTTVTIPATVAPSRVFLLGDSVMAALNPEYTNDARKVIGAAGWNVVIDAKVNRTVAQGRKVIVSRRQSIGDTVVIMLGHNNDPSGFTREATKTLDLLTGVNRVFWLTMREPRYSVSNQALRDLQQTYPNLRIIDWSSVIDLAETSRDGLHLKPSGAQHMAELILSSISTA
jgi:lysophospholipase L1-like esterase